MDELPRRDRVKAAQAAAKPAEELDELEQLERELLDGEDDEKEALPGQPPPEKK
jgi:hypothetical protein